MARCFTSIGPEHRAFIERQKVYFVATAAADGRVNLSPKGLDTLRVLSPGRLVWLNLTGSTNETAAHLRASDRMTLLFCAFEGAPLILKVYGRARTLHARDSDWLELAGHFPPLPGPRQIFDVAVDGVLTSCGAGVPLFDYRGERGDLIGWAERKGEEGVRRYWREHNVLSLDSRPTGILD